MNGVRPHRPVLDGPELDEPVVHQQPAPVGNLAGVGERVGVALEARPSSASVGIRAIAHEVLDEHLADLVRGRASTGHVTHRYLVGGQVLATERVELGAARYDPARRPGRGTPIGNLAQSIVGDADHGGIGDRGVKPEHLGHLGREDLEAAAVDHVAHPALDPDETVGVDTADVAGAEPAVSGEPVGHIGGNGAGLDGRA